MLSIVCGPTGFAVVTAIDSGCKFNAGYYVSKVLTPLSEWWRERGGSDFRKRIVHADNARRHKAIVWQQFMAKNAMAITTANPVGPHTIVSITFFDSILIPSRSGILRSGGSHMSS
jgi:hypothetical protein